MRGCGAFFGSHGCDLSEGHPEELGHVCLLAANDLLPDQGGYHDPISFSHLCHRVETDDPEVFT